MVNLERVVDEDGPPSHAGEDKQNVDNEKADGLDADDQNNVEKPLNDKFLMEGETKL